MDVPSQTSFQHCTGSACQCNESRTGNKKHTEWGWRHKTVFVCKWHHRLCRKSERITKTKQNKTPRATKQLLQAHEVFKVYVNCFPMYQNEQMKFEIETKWTETQALYSSQSNSYWIMGLNLKGKTRR